MTLPFADAPPHCLDDVAVLMPAYNGQADVDLTLASFSERALVHVLIVDDGSTPPIVAPALPNLQIEVLRMPVNGGIERALEAASTLWRSAAFAMRRVSTRATAACRNGSRSSGPIWKHIRTWPGSACGPRSSRARASRFSCCARPPKPRRSGACVFSAHALRILR